MIGQKQRSDNREFVSFFERCKDPSIRAKEEPKLQKLIDRTVKERIAPVLDNKRFGVAWSGGKDSVVLDYVLRQRYKNFPSAIGMTDNLEYPAFSRFVEQNKPPDLTVVKSGHTIEWLAENQKFLFPQTNAIAGRWFKMVQHSAQDKFSKESDFEILLTGRRKKDTNFTGPDGMYRNNKTGLIRFSPLYDWSHEDILRCMVFFDLPVAPCYSWINGWVVGTGAWPARQWTGSVERGWKELSMIDKSIIDFAAPHIQSAMNFKQKYNI